MSSPKTANITLAFAISAALTMTYSQNTVATPLHNPTQSNNPLLLAANDTEAQKWDAYLNSKYAYKDAVNLANFWGKSTYEAKLKIGALLMAENNAAIQKSLQNAQQQAKQEEQQWQAYSDSQYTYEDAELLAQFWGKPAPWDAKLKIGQLLMAENDAVVQKALQQAKQHVQNNVQLNSEDQQWKAYLNSQYTYKDAALLAQFWGKSTPWEAKLKIGRLLMEKNGTAVEKALKNAK